MKKFNNLGSEKNKTTTTEYKLILDTLLEWIISSAWQFLFMDRSFVSYSKDWVWTAEPQSYWTYTLSSLFCKTLLSTGGEATDRVTEPVKFFLLVL